MRYSKLRRRNRSDNFAYVFLIPWLIGIAVFVLRPLGQSLYYAFCQVNMTATGRVAEFVGFQNFSDIWFKDIYFVKRLLNFLVSTLLRLPIIVVFALLIALMLNAKIRLKGLFRTIFFLPVIIVSGPIIDELAAQGATTVPAMQQQDIAVIVAKLMPEWLAEPVTALFSQMILLLWFSGVQQLIFLAVLQKSDLNTLEAARIDGATGWEIFWKITLPSLRQAILLNTIYTLVLLSNSDTNDIIRLISNNMLDPKRGYGFASAMAWIYTIIVALLLLLALGLIKEKRRKTRE